MKIFMKIIFYTAVFLNIVTLSGCSSRNKYKGEVIKEPNYSDVIVIKDGGDKEDIFNVHSNQLVKNGTVDHISEMVYDTQKSVYVYLVDKNKTPKIGSKVVALYGNTKSEIKDFFAVKDIKINPSGDKIAYRAFNSSSTDSAQGMKVYDLKNKKYIELKSKVLVSGNLYEWLDDHRIIYYGNIEGQRNSDKVYLYDLSKDSEQVYLNDTRGYCMYFTTIGDDLLFSSRNQDELDLYYYNHKTGQFKFLSDEFEQIYDSTVDNKNGCVFFIGKNEENIESLYKFTQKDGGVSRITYDFPENIAEYSGIAQSKRGDVYFVGMVNRGSGEDVFMYNIRDKSINIISDQEGIYNIYKEK
ncbi:hypothetical protein ACFHWD_05715 [Clostridium sp. MT-14]|uniref:hypothetical protein n=1 Tax=unclassified Clostridium TaxID=2614128 RepID=UPI00123C7893|nr:hypothetical protein [Clostridium sp. HV4-5-A1G]KAA8676159.1 hypothetical protein F3O63_03535 [Clostridium sp. HV4-5-A1G]CAB1242344.1 Translocation protein TolB [Clostridiaceae bacterium BL-3]